MRPEDQYLQALLAQPAVSTITLADGKPVAVEDVYVSRTLLHEVVQKQEGREITVKLPVELWPKLKDERVVVVEGPAGIGKSTLTKQLVRESRAQHLLPIWMAFRPFVASGLSIGDYLDQHYVPWLGLAGVRVPYRADGTGPDRSVGHWLYEQWKDGFGGLLIIDGLDEVFRHEERVAALQRLPITRTGATRPATILTSRPLSQSLPLQMAKVEVQGLTPSEQIQFMERYRVSLQLTEDQVTHFTNATKKQEQGRLRDLLTRPGHLIQILTTYAKTNTLLDTETGIIDELLKSRLTITGRSEPPVQPDEPEKKHRVLASLALHLLACRQGQRHTRAQLLALIQQVLREQTANHTSLFSLSQVTALLNDLTRNSALLTEVEPEVYEFETVIWLQHLTGSALANANTIAALKLTNTEVLDFLDKKAWDPEWEPVLQSWVGNSLNPSPLFARLIDESQDDLARHRLGTAGRCLVEANTQLRDRPVYKELVTEVSNHALKVFEEGAKRETEEVFITSLRRSWSETEGGQPEPVENVLLKRLNDEDCHVRGKAAAAFRKLGIAISVTAQQALVERTREENRYVREEASQTLIGLGAELSLKAQQALLEQFRDKEQNWYARREAGDILAELGTAMPVPVQEALVQGPHYSP